MKSTGGRVLTSKIQALRPQTAGGTCFFDAVAQCLQMMHRPGLVPPDASRWLICLTDGDDLGSRRENSQGQMVTHMLNSGASAHLNMVMITVGSLKAGNLKVIDNWCEQVSMSGGLGRHVSEKDAAAIAKAFEVVVECLATEVGGATEC
jgi:cell division inhibitor SulA